MGLKERNGLHALSIGWARAALLTDGITPKPSSTRPLSSRETHPPHKKTTRTALRRAGAQLDLPLFLISRCLPGRLRNESRSGSRPSPTSGHCDPYR